MKHPNSHYQTILHLIDHVFQRLDNSKDLSNYYFKIQFTLVSPLIIFVMLHENLPLNLRS